MQFIVRKMTFYPFVFLWSGNTIARAENLQIEPISDYKMGCLLLAYRKVFGGAGTANVCRRQTRANRACAFAICTKKVPANRLPHKLQLRCLSSERHSPARIMSPSTTSKGTRHQKIIDGWGADSQADPSGRYSSSTVSALPVLEGEIISAESPTLTLLR